MEVEQIAVPLRGPDKVTRAVAKSLDELFGNTDRTVFVFEHAEVPGDYQFEALRDDQDLFGTHRVHRAYRLVGVLDLGTGDIKTFSAPKQSRWRLPQINWRVPGTWLKVTLALGSLYFGFWIFVFVAVAHGLTAGARLVRVRRRL